MVKSRCIVGLIVSSFIALPLSAADIRFYKINKDQQTDKLWVSKKKSKKPGCHNFRGSPRVFQVVQIGYQSCSLYNAKNCTEDSLVKASHDDIDAYASTLGEGYGWLPSLETNLDSLSDNEAKNKRGVKLRSWKCEYANRELLQ